MNRRDLLKLLLSSPIAAQFDVEKLLWVKEKVIFIPSQKQIDFINQLDSRLYGIPYHENNASTGIWLGFERR